MSFAFFDADRLRTNDRHFAEVIDLPRQGQGMIEFLLGVDFELSGDVHVFGALEDLGIDDVRNDGLIFTGQVFVQQLRETVSVISSDFCSGILFLLQIERQLYVRTLWHRFLALCAAPNLMRFDLPIQS